MAIRLGRVALAPAARPDAAALPLRLGERRVAVARATRGFVEPAFLVAQSDAVDHCVDARHAARDRHCVFRLRLRLRPNRPARSRRRRASRCRPRARRESGSLRNASSTRSSSVSSASSDSSSSSSMSSNSSSSSALAGRGAEPLCAAAPLRAQLRRQRRRTRRRAARRHADCKSGNARRQQRRAPCWWTTTRRPDSEAVTYGVSPVAEVVAE